MNLRLRYVLTLLLLVICCHSTFSQKASVWPTKLRCEYLENPKGIDVEQPRLSWILDAVDPQTFGQEQRAYQILVASNPKLLKRHIGDLWNSGWVNTDQMQQIVYQGKRLSSDRTYYWTVRVKDEVGKVSRWSEVACWTTGLYSANEWQASWIGSDELYDPYAANNNISDPWLRKTFRLTKKPGKATFFVASVGYHEVYVNGERVGDGVLAPAVSDHTKRARYLAYDIADYLVKGENVIALWLGTSWSIFPGYILHEDRPLTPIAIGQMAVYDRRYPTADAQPMMTITTDASWKVRSSPNKLTGKWDFRRFGGEIWDDRHVVPNWNLTSFDDNTWQNASIYPTRLILSAQMVEQNRLLEEIKPVAIEARADGTYRVDMGVNFAGWTQVEVRANPNDTVRFFYSEREQDDMTFGLHSAFVVGKEAKGTFRNRFNYSSGRWITISGLTQAPTLDDVKGWMVRTDFKNAAHFTSSDSLQNWIFDRVRWTFENLSLGGFIVDCPQRERMGYGGDAHATSETGMFNYELGAFYTKWMEDWRDVQGTESMVGDMLDTNYARKELTSGRILNNGVVPHTAPGAWGGGGPAWGGIVVTLPWFMYQHFGDERVLQENFELISGWLNFLDTHVEDNLLQRFGGIWDFLGDWLWPNATAEGMNNDTPQNLCFNNAYYVFNLRTAAKIARILGHTAQALAWEAKATTTAEAVHRLYFDELTNSYSDGSMANLAAVLLADIPPENLRQKVLDRLEHEIMVVRRGYIHAGITGGALLFKLLREEGRDDLIYAMVSKKEYPSWGHMRAHGATSIWEMWEKDLPGHSLMHSSYLYPGAWYIDGVAGIKRDPTLPGFRRFILRPVAAYATDLSWVEAAFNSPVGQIKSSWSRINGRLQLRVTVPPNTTAILQLQPSEAIDTHAYNTIVSLGEKDGYVQYELKAGQYEF